MSKERPILFSGPMVNAILQGRKTQTRRVVKPQPPEEFAELKTTEKGWFWQDEHALCEWPHESKIKNGLYAGPEVLKCPYGQPKTKLWVRETWQRGDFACNEPRGPVYRATDSDWETTEDWKWKPAIHMPRWASRITLEVTGVRVERLQDISEDDAKAEGVIPKGRRLTHAGTREGWIPHKLQFSDLWREIHSPESWDANPWVWVISFKRIK